MPAPAIRLATLDDADELARLLTELGHATSGADVRATWPAFAASGNLALVAVPGGTGAAGAKGGALLGVAVLHQTIVLHRRRPVGRITALVVDANQRGHGLGRALVAHAERTLREAGCGLLEITSHVRLAEAHAFYERLGYERTSVRFGKVLAADG